MRPRLTQYLIDKNYVTEAQCQEALQRQVIFGGRLGTNLLELCHVREEHLLEALSASLRAPVADLNKLTIPKELIDSFPSELAQKHQVLPIEDAKGRLHLAMIDPNNLDAIDEISFITGKSVKPYIASELRISYLLEEYYGVERGRNFLALPEELQKRRQAWEERQRSEVPTAPEPSPPAAPAAPAPSPAQPTEKVPDVPPPPAPRATQPVEPPPLDFNDYDDCSRAMADSRNRDDIANVLMAFARSRMDRVVLFIVKGDEVQGWRVGGQWDTPRNVKSVKFSAKEASVVHHVAQTGEMYRGPLLEVPAHRKILETLGGAFPEEVVAVPLTIRKRVISVLVADNSQTRAPFDDLLDLQKLTMKAAIAFEILILKAKILFR